VVKKVFDGLKTIDERESLGQPSAAHPEQVDRLPKEMKELIELLKAKRGQAKKTETR